VVPDTGGIVHTLVASSEKDSQLFRRRLTVRWRNDHQPGSVLERDEGLTAQGVTLKDP